MGALGAFGAVARDGSLVRRLLVLSLDKALKLTITINIARLLRTMDVPAFLPLLYRAYSRSFDV